MQKVIASALSDDELFDVLNSLFDASENYVRGADEPLSQKGRDLSVSEVRELCVEALVSRDDQTTAVMAIELLAARPDVDTSDIVATAPDRDRTSTEDIYIMDLIHKRPDKYSVALLVKFLAPEKAELVRQTAARLILVHVEIDDTEPFLVRFETDEDTIVKINLAAALFQKTRNNMFLAFVQSHKRSLILDVAREARECEGLALFGDPYPDRG